MRPPVQEPYHLVFSFFVHLRGGGPTYQSLRFGGSLSSPDPALMSEWPEEALLSHVQGASSPTPVLTSITREVTEQAMGRQVPFLMVGLDYQAGQSRILSHQGSDESLAYLPSLFASPDLENSAQINALVEHMKHIILSSFPALEPSQLLFRDFSLTAADNHKDWEYLLAEESARAATHCDLCQLIIAVLAESRSDACVLAMIKLPSNYPNPVNLQSPLAEEPSMQVPMLWKEAAPLTGMTFSEWVGGAKRAKANALSWA